MKYKLNLRHDMGTIFHAMEKYDFNSFSGIKAAYGAVFERDCTEKFDVASGRDARTLESTRNLLAHRAGVIDERFIEQIAEAYKDAPSDGPFQVSLSDLKKSLRLDGMIVDRLVGSAAELALSLLEYVDLRLGPSQDDDTGPPGEDQP